MSEAPKPVMSDELADEYVIAVSELKAAREAVERAEAQRNYVLMRGYDDGLSAVQLAEMFGISRQMVHRIVKA